MKTKIGTEVAHVTRDSDTTFKVKMSKVKVTVLARQEAAAVGVGTCWPCETAATYVAVCSGAQGASAPTGEEKGGAYRGGRPPTACWNEYIALSCIIG